MESVQESLYPPEEKYAADKIDHIVIDKDCISIYLEDSKLIEVSASMDIHAKGIRPVLDVRRAFWGRIPDNKR